MIQKDGFDFSFDETCCKECGGKCCYGESGYIFVSVAEMRKIAEFLNMSLEDLALKYVRKVGYRFSFIEQKCVIESDGVRCVFFNENTKCCDIYPVRPRQCVTFPFWDMYKKDKSELLSRCIGICPKGSKDRI